MIGRQCINLGSLMFRLHKGAQFAFSIEDLKNPTGEGNLLLVLEGSYFPKWAMHPPLTCLECKCWMQLKVHFVSLIK